MKTNFDDLLPVERQLILVASDEKYSALVKEIPWSKFLYIIPALLLPYYYLLPLIAIGKDELRKLLQIGEIPIPHLSPREADKRFKFDHGHPNDGSVYIAHPVLPDHYLVPAIANERLAQEKVAAFLDLTAALGAKTLEVVSAEFLEHKKNSNANITSEAAKVGIEFSSNSTADHVRNFSRTFEQPDNPPQLPDHVKKWLDEDPIFRSVTYARLNAKGISDKAQLRIENHFSFNSSITLRLEKAGIKAGGEVKKIASAVFGFSIEYWPVVNN